MNERLFCPYLEAAAWQRELVLRRLAGSAPDLLLLVEHEPVVTLGTAARESHLLLSREEFDRRGIAIVRTDRGGDVTYHGPGQLAIYPIVKLAAGERDPHLHLRRLEEAGVRTLGSFGLEAFRSPGMTGIWTRRGKIAAIGVHLRRWVTYHGMALNVRVDLAAFSAIVPCGLADRRVTSMAELLAGGPAPDLDLVANVAAERFEEVFERRFEIVRGGDRRHAFAGD